MPFYPSSQNTPEHARPRLSLAVARALIRQLTPGEVLRNFDRTFQQEGAVREELIGRLADCCDEDASSVSYVRQLVHESLEAEDDVPPRKRQTLEWALKELIALLPVEEQVEIAPGFLLHDRYRRRLTGYKIVRAHFRPALEVPLRESINRFGDPAAIETLLNVGADISDCAETLITYYENFDEREEGYKRALVFCRLVSQDLPQAIDLASVYPIPFVRGCGWARCSEGLPTIRQIYDGYRDDYEILGLFVWVFGRLGARDELRQLAKRFDMYTQSLPDLFQSA